MLSDTQINEIHRLHWHQKWSLRQIARHLNLNRRTVAKYRSSRRSHVPGHNAPASWNPGPSVNCWNKTLAPAPS